MNYKYADNFITLADCDSFDISQTLECGQCFRYTRLSDRDYIIVAFSKMLRITQHGDVTEFYPCVPDEFEKIWVPYFDLRRDYSAIKRTLSADPVMARAIEFAGGIRILNQDPWECLLSFIISQNMNIPRIKKLIGTLSERYGSDMGEFYAFPSAEQILPAGVDGLTDCRTGFRAKYLFDAISKIADGKLDLSGMTALPTAELKTLLKSIYGVGNKVADCVLLFSFGRHEVFPMDVWIKRAMQQLYFDGREVRPKDAYIFAQEKFGSLAGVAQQYLFHYMRAGLGK
ncbi:MAG: hypothetical protein FWE68_01735 [Defluviitaleaceae bacterium]|nr:hypothetical protein [Defluviitaleaceae bacterium]